MGKREAQTYRTAESAQGSMASSHRQVREDGRSQVMEELEQKDPRTSRG